MYETRKFYSLTDLEDWVKQNGSDLSSLQVVPMGVMILVVFRKHGQVNLALETSSWREGDPSIPTTMFPPGIVGPAAVLAEVRLSPKNAVNLDELPHLDGMMVNGVLMDAHVVDQPQGAQPNPTPRPRKVTKA